MKRARKKLLPPYLQWREGRPRWEPGPALRTQGFHGRDLKDDGGQWLGLEAAIGAARRVNGEIAEWRRTGEIPKKQPKHRKTARTCGHLFETWASPADPQRASPRWQALSPTTQRDYAYKASLFVAAFGDEPAAAISKADMHDWWEELYRERGHAMANGTLAVVRAMFSYAEIKGWRATNPCKGLGLVHLPPRLETWLPAEIDAALTAAAQLGLDGIGDAIVIALQTGQRQGDVLRLALESTAGGRARFRQSKRGARVSVPFTPALRERLEAITARRRQGATPQITPIGELVRDARGRPYANRWRFGKDFRAVRARAVELLTTPQTPAPDLATKQFLDLRDTAVTRLALAECTVPEISAITGHEMHTVHQVLKHYIARSDAMADTAITRLVAYLQREGIAV